MAVQLQGIDAAFLSLESATGHLQGVGVVRFVAGAPRLSLDELTDLVARRLPRLDLLRRQLVTVPGGLDRPYWIDVEPDLREHIRSHHLPGNGDPADLERFCADLASRAFDRSTPMWEFWLVDGLPSGAQALVMKIHHSLCDGIGSLALVAQLFDDRPESPDDGATPTPPPTEDRPAVPWLLGRAALHALRLPFDLAATSVELAASALRLRTAIGDLSGIDLAAPLATPHLPFHGPVTAERSIALRDLSIDRVKRVAKASDTRVNDVILATLAGTFRSWLIGRGQLPDQPLVAAVPVSTRGPDQLFDPGNHVSALFVHLPTNIEDPRERLAVTASVANGGKAVHTAFGPSMLERLTSLTFPLVLSVPATVYQRTQAAEHHPAPVNLVVSNVAGPPFDLYLAGRPAEAFYALGPIFDGVGLNITAVSYRGVLGLGYVACPDRLDDLHALADCQDAAFEVLAEAYGV